MGKPQKTFWPTQHSDFLSLKSKCQQAGSFWGLREKTVLGLSPSFWAGCLQSLQFLGFQQHRSNLCLHPHKAVSFCASVTILSSSHKDTITAFGPILNQLWPPCNMILSAKSLFPNKVTSPGARGEDLNRFFGEKQCNPQHLPSELFKGIVITFLSAESGGEWRCNNPSCYPEE